MKRNESPFKWRHFEPATILLRVRRFEFMLSAKRGLSAAKRLFKKLMRADHRRLPFTIGTDEHASYPEAFATSLKERIPPPDCAPTTLSVGNPMYEPLQDILRSRVFSSVPFFDQPSAIGLLDELPRRGDRTRTAPAPVIFMMASICVLQELHGL